MTKPAQLPFEFAHGGISDVTHVTAKRLLSIARRVAKGELTDEVVVAARAAVAEVNEKKSKRLREAGRLGGMARARRAGRRAA